ncbi:MAG: transcriptional repressor [Pygmaiobacter sp.]|jgi:Fe2+ or Zn2+ uptake regulation protein|nr:transcriptional repressor [Pygmaiobacter sp.]
MEKRNTVQKQLVLQAVQELKSHPTADEVYRQVVVSHPSISKATVYRNLNSLAEDGVVGRVAMPNAADRFDFVPQQHYHIKCVNCGRVIDAPGRYHAELDTQAQQDTDFQILRHDLVFEGLCPDCQKRTN